MLAGSEEPFVTLGSLGWLEALSPSGSCCRGRNVLANRDPVLDRSPYRALSMLVGSEGLREIPGWGHCLKIVWFMSWQGDKYGEDRGWEGGDLFWRVSVVR